MIRDHFTISKYKLLWKIFTSNFLFFFLNRRILLHGKNSQKRDNIKKKDNKTTKNPNVCTQIETKTKSKHTVGGLGLALEIQTVKAELLIY